MYLYLMQENESYTRILAHTASSGKINRFICSNIKNRFFQIYPWKSATQFSRSRLAWESTVLLLIKRSKEKHTNLHWVECNKLMTTILDSKMTFYERYFSAEHHNNILTRHVVMSIETMFCFFSLDCCWLCCCWLCGLEFSFPDTFGEMKSSSFSDNERKLLIKC